MNATSSSSSSEALRSRTSAAVPAGGELEPRERVDRHRVGLDAAHVAEGDVGAARPEQRAHPLAEARAGRRVRSDRGSANAIVRGVTGAIGAMDLPASAELIGASDR